MRKRITTTAGAIALACLSTSTWAAEPATSNRTSHETGARHHHSENQSQTFRASQLTGLEVENHNDDDVGEIRDLVMDSKGKTRYVAVSAGGFLGIGDRLFALPYDTITFMDEDAAEGEDDQRAIDTNLDDTVAVVQISREQLKNAEGFNQDVWPNMADPQWRDRNDRGYASVPRRKVKHDKTHPNHKNTNHAQDRNVIDRGVYRASELIGLNVYTGTGDDAETIGEINDVVVDSDTGDAKYVALSVGGFLGIGNKLFAVPYKQIKLTKNSDNEIVATMSATKQTFENAEGFNQDNWPNMASQSWRERNDRSYGERNERITQ